MTDVLPRLVRGSHKAGSGAGCILNLKSWEHGDSYISDKPQGFVPASRSLLLTMNDYMCGNGVYTQHNNMYEICPTCTMYMYEICPTCTMLLMDLADFFDGLSPNSLSWEAVNVIEGAYSTIMPKLAYGRFNISAHNGYCHPEVQRIARRMMEKVTALYNGNVPKTNRVPIVRTLKEAVEMMSLVTTREVASVAYNPLQFDALSFVPSKQALYSEYYSMTGLVQKPLQLALSVT